MGPSAPAKLRLWWGGVAAYDGANELSLMSDYDDGGSNRIMICGPTADNFPSDTIQLQANNGLSIYSGASPFPPEYHLHVSGDVGGTGIGDRITLNGTGYLLSGDSPAETQTLQQVCDNDNTTTTSILSTGPHISGVTGLFGDKVGIGTSVPAYPLEVLDSAAGAVVRIKNTESAGTPSALLVGIKPTDGGLEIAKFTYGASDTSALTIKGDSSTFAGKVVARGGTITNAGYRFDSNGDTDGGILSPADGQISFVTDATERMRINRGNVGIGTTDPAELLHVSGGILLADKNDAAETWHNIIVADNSASGVNTLAGIGFNAQGWTNDIAKAGIFQKREGSYGRGSLFFVNNNDGSWTSATEADAAITIDPDARVGIGTTNPDGVLLDVNDTTASDNKCIAQFEGQGIGASRDDGGQYISIVRNSPISQADGAMGGIFFGLGSNPASAGAIVRGNYKYTDGRDLEFLTSPDNTGQAQRRMVVKGDGKVGIGTEDPASELHVEGADTDAIRAYGGSYYASIGANSNAAWIMAGGSPGHGLRLGAGGNGAMSVYASRGVAIGDYATTDPGADNFTVVGSIGIGTTSALAKLDVRGTISGSGDFLGTGVGNRITNNGTPYLLSGDAASALTLQNVCDNGSTTTTSVTISDDLIVDTDTLFVDASTDRVGIGTSAPDAMLHISGGSALIQGISQSYAKFYHSVSASDYVSTSANVFALNSYYATNEYGIYVNNAGNFSIAKSGSANALVISNNHITMTGSNLKFESIQSTTSPAINLRGAENGDEVGIYSPATNKFSIVTDRLDRVVVDEVGNVGIGTASPNALLEINDNIPRFSLYDTATSKRWEINKQYGGLNFAEIGAADMRLFLKDGGDVGIGVDPSYALDVSSSTTDQVARFKSSDADAFISIEDNYDSVYIGHSSGDNVMSLGFNTPMGSTSNLTINPLGNVGIGTNVPDSSVPLTILGPSAGRFMTLDAPTDGAYMTFETATTAYADIGSEKAITAAGAVDDLLINVRGSRELVFKTNSTERLRIDSAGFVGVGTGNPAATLDVDGTMRIRSSSDINDWVQWAGIRPRWTNGVKGSK